MNTRKNACLIGANVYDQNESEYNDSQNLEKYISEDQSEAAKKANIQRAKKNKALMNWRRIKLSKRT